MKKFTKKQLLQSEHFQNRKDILNVLLSDDETYTIIKVEQLIEEYMKGKVD